MRTSVLVACDGGVVQGKSSVLCCPCTALFLVCEPAPVWQRASRKYVEVGLFMQATMHHPRRWLAGCTSGMGPSQETMLLHHQ